MNNPYEDKRPLTEEEHIWTEPIALRVEALVQEVKPLLAGKGPEVQSAVLADLLAMWLSGMRSPDPKEQIEFRTWAMNGFQQLVWDLVAMYDQLPTERDKN